MPIVKASLTGSIVGNLLFGLGLAMFAGGLRYRRQSFDPDVAQMNCALLMLAAFGLIIPAVFRFSARADRGISLEISVILFVVYLAGLLYTLVTSKATVGKEAVKAELKEKGTRVDEVEESEQTMGRNQAIGLLVLVTIGLAVMSEVMTGAIEPAAEKLGLTPIFAGVFLLALVSNVPQVFNAVSFARKDKMDLAIGITVGASTQVALLVAPVLVFLGYLMGQDMELVFSQFELVSIILAVLVTRTLIVDGTSNWLEGLMLVAVYLMLGVGFFYAPAGTMAHHRHRRPRRPIRDPGLVPVDSVRNPLPVAEASPLRFSLRLQGKTWWPTAVLSSHFGDAGLASRGSNGWGSSCWTPENWSVSISPAILRDPRGGHADLEESIKFPVLHDDIE